MNFIFPTYPDTKDIDQEYKEEYTHVIELGFKPVLIDFENRKIYNKSEGPFIYRGWILSNEDFIWLKNNLNLIFDFEHYQKHHYVHSWYPLIKEHTFHTEFFSDIKDIPEFKDIHFLKNDAKFISIVETKEETISALKEYHYGKTDMFCLRKFIPLKFKEKRFFCYKGKTFPTVHPEIVDIIIEKIGNGFYTIDIDQDINGNHIVVEIGDGQVSGLKHIPYNELYKLIGENK